MISKVLFCLFFFHAMIGYRICFALYVNAESPPEGDCYSSIMAKENKK